MKMKPPNIYLFVIGAVLIVMSWAIETLNRRICLLEDKEPQATMQQTGLPEEAPDYGDLLPLVIYGDGIGILEEELAQYKKEIKPNGLFFRDSAGANVFGFWNIDRVCLSTEATELCYSWSDVFRVLIVQDHPHAKPTIRMTEEGPES